MLDLAFRVSGGILIPGIVWTGSAGPGRVSAVGLSNATLVKRDAWILIVWYSWRAVG